MDRRKRPRTKREKKWQKYKQEQIDRANSLRRIRESAPPPEPSPSPTKMKVNAQPPVQSEGGSWGKYAYCDSLAQFGNLKPSDKGHPLSVPNKDQNLDKQEQKQDVTAPHTVTESTPAKATPIESQDVDLRVESLNSQHKFGEASSRHCSTEMRLRIQSDGGKVQTEIEPRHARSLDDFYIAYPEKMLQGGIEPSTIDLAARVILKLVNDAAYQWLEKWCPHMDLCEVFEALRAEGEKSSFPSKKYNVPSDAIDANIGLGSLSDTYEHLQGVFSKDPGNVSFHKLMELIDQSVIFSRAVKDTKRKTLLQKTRSMFQWFPIGLDSKKAHILKKAKDDFVKLGKTYKNSSANGEANLGWLSQKRLADELGIVGETLKQFDSHREWFETQMLDRLDVLLAATSSSSPIDARLHKVDDTL
ncbi:hypothetical protein F5Y03DRAFT_405340 [Xylaria venustula]|nr:hypothetical protein F5Y03DRAFT_405340 [Xylaria venustula]